MSAKNKSDKNKVLSSRAISSPRVEIQKHFDINSNVASKINSGVESFPYVGELENADKILPEIVKVPKRTFNYYSNPRPSTSSLSSADLNYYTDPQFKSSKYDSTEMDCLMLNNKMAEINKEIAKLEDDIQNSFYVPGKTLHSISKSIPKYPVGNIGNVKKSVTVFPTSTKFEIEKKPEQNVTSECLKLKSDPSLELKNEIMEYRRGIKEKVLAEKMERKLEELYKRNRCMEQENKIVQPTQSATDLADNKMDMDTCVR